MDTMYGGTGNDTYYVDNIGDVVIEAVDEGTDTVRSSVSFILGTNLEQLVLTNTDSINGTGNELNNNIYGNAANNILTGNDGNDYLSSDGGVDILYGGEGNDTLIGGTGIDTMYGGSGNDTYYVDNAGDIAAENLDEGTDSVRSTITYTLGDNLENLTLTNTDAINGTGNSLDNRIYGNSGSNTLSGNEGNDYLSAGDGDDTLYGGIGNDSLIGGIGADTMYGGSGNDTYYIDNLNDVVTEAVDEGTDSVQSSITYILGDNLENLTLTGTDPINGTGNDVANVINGNNASNILSGLGGNDTLTGKDSDDTLYGGEGNDTLNGGIGADIMIGGSGNDTYYVDNAGDTVTEAADEGTDTVRSSVSFILGDNLEQLVLTGTDAINGTGNELNNNIYGNIANNTLTGNIGNDYLSGADGDDILIGMAGNDTLIGGTGVDNMIGNSGNDTYYVDNAGDIVTEYADEGTDSVRSTITYTLGDNLENLTLTGTDAINGTGNASNNTIYGNAGSNILIGNDGNDYLSADTGDDTLRGGAGNDTLIGGTGADIMIGGMDNDTYYVDNTGDTTIETADEGTDTVRSSVTFTLGDNLEQLVLTGTDAIDGTGNELNNNIYGNVANNTLTGNDGNDYLSADGGDDTLIGKAGNDTLIGGTGVDIMIGNSGNDTYCVDNTGDIVTEYADEGTDAVRSSVTYTLGSNIENLTLTGTDPVNGTGNELNNVIYGNSASNILSGVGGNDTLAGSNADDTLIGGTGNDVLNGGTGSDTYVFSSGSNNDTITDSGSDALFQDRVLFTDDVLRDTVAIYQRGSSLYISYGDMNKTTVGNQTSPDYGIEKIELSSGQFLTDADVNLVIQQMTAFAANNGISLTNVDDVRRNQDLMGMVVNAWHS
jgi:Ca2+-binding RTX toxin-like protein